MVSAEQLATGSLETRDLDVLRRSAEIIRLQLVELRRALDDSNRSNLEQAGQIRSLQEELADIYARQLVHEKHAFFAALRERLGASPVYEVGVDRVVVANDPVFVFGKGEVGEEGRDRLWPLLTTLVAASHGLPPEGWRLRIEGHTDTRPVRGNRRFFDNWGLSSARALSMLRLLESSGIRPERLEAVGLAATRVLDQGLDGAAHRRNRRIEIHLVASP